MHQEETGTNELVAAEITRKKKSDPKTDVVAETEEDTQHNEGSEIDRRTLPMLSRDTPRWRCSATIAVTAANKAKITWRTRGWEYSHRVNVCVGEFEMHTTELPALPSTAVAACPDRLKHSVV